MDQKYNIPNGSSSHFFFFQGGLLGEIITSWKIRPREEATFLQEKRNYSNFPHKSATLPPSVNLLEIGMFLLLRLELLEGIIILLQFSIEKKN